MPAAAGRASVVGLAVILFGLPVVPAAAAGPVAPQAAAPADDARSAMQDADRRLSRAVQTRDLDAFTDMLAGDVIFVGETGPAALGRAAVRAEWDALFQPEGPSLSWEPVTAEVSDRGELGYIRGRFVHRLKDASGRAVEQSGEYLSIWRKDPDGRWRVVIDSTLPASPPGFVGTDPAPSRVLAANLSGDLRYELRATRMPPVTATQPTGPFERRVLRVDRRKVDGTWTPLVEAVTVGPAPKL